jgi:hypothetical protein
MPGNCLVGTNYFHVDNKETCDAALGTYYPDGTGTGTKDTTLCFISSILTRTLAQTILNLGTTYQAQLDFRDKVLNTSPAGKRFVKLYYGINPAMLAVAAANFALLGKAIDTWYTISPFVAAVVRTASDADAGASLNRVRFTKTSHRKVISLFGDLRTHSQDKALKRALDEVERELNRYVGLTPSAALAMLQRKGSGSRSSRKR